MASITFAVPGDIDTPTGGYRYDRAVLGGLRAAGHDVTHLRLGVGFPFPSPAELDDAAAQLAAVPASQVLIVDGLAFGAMPAAQLAAVKAKMVALVHHPLALETGLAPAQAATLEASERAALPFAQHVVVTSPHTADTLVAQFGVERTGVTVALPGLSRRWGETVRAPVSPPLVVSVGSVSPRKGFDVLIDALAGLREMAWRCEIVGSLAREGETAQALFAQVARLGLSERIAFRGALEEAQIGALYGAASVFALATRYEGFGMVFAEAMAAGLPIVGTTGGAVPGVVPPQAGRLVPPDDAPAFAAALGEVLSDADLRAQLGEGARAAGAAFA
ncbi:MAG: glycosyltransferase family 4 protein, partial [Pseudomonadota bacterium]